MAKFIRYRKPQKLDSLTLHNHAVIEASAGTGKTYTMEHLVVELLLRADARIDEILVVTFTERATSDLKKRIRALLETITMAYDRGVTMPAAAGPYWEIGEEEYSRLRSALVAFDVAPIYTIHGFCQRILTEHAFQNHRLFDETHVDFDALFDEVFAEALRRDFARDPGHTAYLTAWMQTQPTALSSLRKLLATCVRSRAALRPSFDEPNLILILDRFARLSSEALLEKLEKEFARQKIHHATSKAFRRHVADLLDLIDEYHESGNLPLFLAQSDVLLNKYIYKKGNVDLLELGGKAAHALHKLISYLVPLQAAIMQRFVPVLRRRLREEKDTEGLYSYDDMLSMVWESLDRAGPGARGQGRTASPEGAELTQVLRRRYRYALIDEFQDTDDIQWQIFKRIFHESAGQNILYIIGDPKQAIYGFRGADVYTYLRAREEILKGGGALVRLDENYRSTSGVIDAYNHIFDQQSKAPFFTGAINYEHPVRCGRPELALTDGAGSDISPVQIVHLQAPKDEKFNARLVRHGFARLFAAEIRDALERKFSITGADEKPRRIQPRDIFVLTRKKKEGELMGQYLRAAGVPFSFYKQDGLFQTSEARDIHDLLGAVVAVHDRAKRYQAWVTPFFRVPLRDLVHCENLPETHPLYEDLAHWHALGQSRRFEEMFASIIDRSGLIRREIFLNSSERELTNYIHIFEILLEEAGHSRLDIEELNVRLQAFIEQRALPEGQDGNVQRLESERDAVQIMTMHKSKGLEADLVFVFGGFTGFFNDGLQSFHDEEGQPVLHAGTLSARDHALMTAEEAEEDQRLLYVALTRARGRIYLPFIGKQSDGKKEKWEYNLYGTYAQLNERLDAVVRGLADGGLAGGVLAESEDPLFAVKSVAYAPPIVRQDSQGLYTRLSNWSPPRALFASPDSDHGARLSALREDRQIVTSYSRMKAAKGGYQTHLEIDEFKSDSAPAALVALGEGALPGGAEAGNFLHQVLEELDFEWVVRNPELATWLEDDEVDELFSRLMLEYAIEEQYRPYSKALIHKTLQTVVRAGDVCIPSLASCKSTIFELEFIYPIPEEHHPTLDALEDGSFTVRRGYIKGFVDFVFEHEGRIYFADWKSDILDDYSPANLEAHISSHYDIQARLYSIAMVKMLGLKDPEAYRARFGGFFYFFLRGMGPGSLDTSESPGVHYQRPAWEELLAYEEELIFNTVYQ